MSHDIPELHMTNQRQQGEEQKETERSARNGEFKNVYDPTK
jgi:hypothetical protein